MNTKQRSDPEEKPQFLSVPVWDISDEEIAEWRQTLSLRFAAYTAECIRDGRYDNDEEVYPYPQSFVYQQVSQATVAEIMKILAERGMVRFAEGAWRAVAPGRMEPSTSRAIALLLARRADLPPALATELESWKQALDAINAPDAPPPAQAAMARSPRRPRPALAVAAR